jgi:ParB family chromosome partitioning protein
MNFDYKFDLSKETVQKIPLAQIRPFKGQPRRYFDKLHLQELADSIKSLGQSDPILVKRLEHPDDDCLYEIVKGERRWLAHKLAGVTDIDAIIIKVKDESEQFLICLGTDIHNESLSLVEIALNMQKLDGMAFDRGEIAKIFSKSPSWVDSHATLLKLSSEVLRFFGPEVPEGKMLSLGHASLLLGLPEDQQISFGKTISEQELSIGEARQLIAKISAEQGASNHSHGSPSPSGIPEEILGFVKKAQLLVSKWSSMADKQFQVEMDKIKWRDREELIEKLESICGELIHLKESITRTQDKAKTKK